jgi:hypothetical protein
LKRLNQLIANDVLLCLGSLRHDDLGMGTPVAKSGSALPLPRSYESVSKTKNQLALPNDRFIVRNAGYGRTAIICGAAASLVRDAAQGSVSI